VGLGSEFPGLLGEKPGFANIGMLDVAAERAGPAPSRKAMICGTFALRFFSATPRIVILAKKARRSRDAGELELQGFSSMTRDHLMQGNM